MKKNGLAFWLFYLFETICYGVGLIVYEFAGAEAAWSIIDSMFFVRIVWIIILMDIYTDNTNDKGL